jgi:hypothetical protein
MTPIDFQSLRDRWDIDELTNGFNTVEEYFQNNPNIISFSVSDFAKTVGINNFPAACVALQCMEEDGLIKYTYGVEDNNGILLPFRWDDIEEIPLEYSNMDIKMFYERVVNI